MFASLLWLLCCADDVNLADLDLDDIEEMDRGAGQRSSATTDQSSGTASAGDRLQGSGRAWEDSDEEPGTQSGYAGRNGKRGTEWSLRSTAAKGLPRSFGHGGCVAWKFSSFRLDVCGSGLGISHPPFSGLLRRHC
jgi:hypothetical protein